MPLSADGSQQSCHDLFKAFQQLEAFLATVFAHLQEGNSEACAMLVFFPRIMLSMHHS